MKRFAIASLLLFAAARAEAADYTDIWYNAAQSGYGFNIVESDDGTGAHFIDGELQAVVSGLPGAAGYRVEPDGAGGFTETALIASPLPGSGG